MGAVIIKALSGFIQGHYLVSFQLNWLPYVAVLTLHKIGKELSWMMKEGFEKSVSVIRDSISGVSLYINKSSEHRMDCKFFILQIIGL